MRLRDITIRTKLFGMTIFSAAVLAVMMGISVWALRTFRVDGPVYRETARNKDVVADVLPPPMYIIEAYLIAQQADGQQDPKRLADLKSQMAQLEQNYQSQYDKWSLLLPDGELKASLVRNSAKPAFDFFRTARDEYFPALARGDLSRAHGLLTGPLTQDYEQHRTEINRTVGLAEAQTHAIETQTARRARFWTTALLLLGLASLGLLWAVTWPLARDIIRSTRLIKRRVDRMAGGEGDLTTRVRIDSTDEMGQLAKGINATFDKMAAVAQRARDAEEEVRQISDRLSLATRVAGIGIWDWDVVNDKLMWDDTMYRLYGVRRQDFGGAYDAWAKCVHPDDLQCAEDAVQTALREGHELTCEFRVIWQDESIHYIQTIGQVFHDARGHAVRMLGVSYDVTARKRVAAELRSAKETAEAANRAKDHFIAILSHELRTPLTPVLGKLLILERDQHLPSEIHSALAMMRRNIELEVRLIEDLLDLHGMMRGELKLEFRTVDVHDALRTTVDTCATQINDRRQRVDLELHAEQHTIRADPVRLQQVFWNLLGNAIKYTPPGGHITLRTSNTPEGQLRVDVQDNGIGIPPEVMGRIFHPFVQGEQTLSRHYGGLGLGLAISKSLVEAQDGTLSATSEGKDRGTTFTALFPTVQPATLPGVPRASPSADGTPRRILLVEDDADTLRTMTRLLRVFKHEVRTAMTLREALSVAKRWNFDLLVSDIGLPDGTGWDLMSQLRRQRPTKGIAISGFVTNEDVHRSKDAGFEEHLAKPLKLEALESAIQATTRAA